MEPSVQILLQGCQTKLECRIIKTVSEGWHKHAPSLKTLKEWHLEVNSIQYDAQWSSMFKIM